MIQKYDVIVVGAGHAGCEAAHAAATLGSSVLLLTMNMNTIAQMSCNPAMGGVAKGQILREIDALGGISGVVSDISAIQFRMLNKSKGPAMWSPRTQNDRYLFANTWRTKLEENKNISLLATSSTTKYQIFKYKNHAYGIQCHIEIKKDTVQSWGCIPEYKIALEESLGEGALEKFDKDSQSNISNLNNYATSLYNNFMKIL